MRLKSLSKYQKRGLWLAVVFRRNKLLVASAAKTARKALNRAHNLGFKKAALIKSGRNYALWAPKNA